MSDDIVARAQAALEGVTDEVWQACGTWVTAEVDTCTCDGPHDTYGHRPECGLEPLFNCGNADVANQIAAAHNCMPELLAEVGRLHTWAGLMSLLDEHWPETILPTLEDHPGRDTGPRIVSLLRWVEQQRAEVERLRAAITKLADDLAAHNQTTPDDDDHEIICDVESTIACRIRAVLGGGQ